MKTKILGIKWGSTLNICQPETRHIVAAQAELALKRGETVTWEDGRKEWLEVVHLVDLSKRGSKMYTWDRAGMKVKAEVFRVTRAKDGSTSRRKVGTRFTTF